MAAKDPFLRRLEDPVERVRFVEVLRASAARLDETDAGGALGSAHRKLAAALRNAAQSLCDHGRAIGPRCVYCEGIILSKGTA